ncbi:cytochrome c3 family protein [Ferrimonas balearica]|uniref:cytochrome c3 family protein n=1 Tax=Ferrimonas balearica TaxID=44012 RepID=UPI001C99A7B2|nr:cytochrome c3 family protein [Ferrimonas balearica]MBY5991059.1 cytochrome c3 family protein [Ferrimonas balearica]
MLKNLLCALFGLGLAFGVAAADTLADVHAEMNGCESCHQDGEPSSDGAFENEQCQSCHGPMAELEGDHHAAHADMLMCADCHNPHELEIGQQPSCDDCHDDGRTP